MGEGFAVAPPSVLSVVGPDARGAVAVTAAGVHVAVDLDAGSVLPTCAAIQWRPEDPVRVADGALQAWMPEGVAPELAGVWLVANRSWVSAGAGRLVGASLVGFPHLPIELYTPLELEVFAGLTGHLGTLTHRGVATTLPVDCGSTLRDALRDVPVGSMAVLEAASGWSPMLRRTDGGWLVVQAFHLVTPLPASTDTLQISGVELERSFLLDDEQIVAAVVAMVTEQDASWRTMPLF